MIKAVFFDIDGTLLGYKSHNLLPGTVEAFSILKERGVKTFISSGRPMVLIPKLPLHFDGYITVNGGYCIVGDQVILRNTINPDDADRWLQYVRENNLTTMCFTEHDMFINRIDPVATALRDQLGFEMPPVRPLEEFKGQEPYQFIAIQPAEQDEAALSLLPHCRMPRWHNLFTDLIPADSSKAVGIERILAHFGIDRNESIAFGDGANDIEMLQYVGTGIAMGNAADIVKQNSDLVTDSADDEGIWNALKKLNVI